MSTPRHKPCCQSLLPWLRANLGADSLAPLTGTDARALAAAVHIVELYSVEPYLELTTAFRLVVTRMQPSTQELAYHAIAMVMDWDQRWLIWSYALLPPIQNPRRCANEPKG